MSKDIVHRKVGDKKSTKRKFNVVSFIIFVLQIIFFVVLTIFAVQLNIVPFKYLIVLLLILFMIDIFSIFLINRRQKILKAVGYLLAFLILFVNMMGIYYIDKAIRFFEDGFTNSATISTDYIILTNKNNPINSIEELDKDSSIYYYKYSKSIDLALNKLGGYNYIDIDNVSKILSTINDVQNSYLLVSKGSYDYLMASTMLFDEENYKIIKEFSVSYKENKNSEIKNSYTIYLNGVDFTGVMRDFNMLITINTNTKKIVLTPVIRGYYVDVPGYNIKDTLMCLGALDSEISKMALENLFDINIDYVININTNSLVNVVDMLGGIEFCSDYSFRTTHSVVKDTYNDAIGRKLFVNKGCKVYNGLEILTISRERLNLKNNERGRLDNCKKILLSIIKKTLSKYSLMNFEQVLDSYNSLYTTDMNKKVITNLFKSLIDSYDEYEIIELKPDGIDGVGLGHLGTQEVGVIYPNMVQVNEASNTIKKVLDGK